MIAESCAAGSTLDGFRQLRLQPLAAKYGARLVDLDQTPVAVVGCLDERDMRPHPVRVANLLMDPDVYVISTTRFKTHDRVVATLSLKNIVVGAASRPAAYGQAARARKRHLGDQLQSCRPGASPAPAPRRARRFRGDGRQRSHPGRPGRAAGMRGQSRLARGRSGGGPTHGDRLRHGGLSQLLRGVRPGRGGPGADRDPGPRARRAHHQVPVLPTASTTSCAGGSRSAGRPQPRAGSAHRRNTRDLHVRQMRGNSACVSQPRELRRNNRIASSWAVSRPAPRSLSSALRVANGASR